MILRGDEAVLVDFDAARIWRPDLPCGADTTILGTTGYAAPEQYGLSQTDPRADLYSLGVLLNVMVTGEHPARTLAPGRLGQIVQRCTMTSPQHRYKDALHLLAAL